MSEESENETEHEAHTESAQAAESIPVEPIPAEPSVTQSVTYLDEERPVATRRLPGWLLPGIGVLIIAAAIGYLPRLRTQPLPTPTEVLTATAAEELAVLVGTSTPTEQPTLAPTPTIAATATEIEPTPTLAAQINITDLLSSDIPVIELPDLPNAIASNPLPAVAAEGGKPVIIAAMAAKQPRVGGLTWNNF